MQVLNFLTICITSFKFKALPACDAKSNAKRFLPQRVTRLPARPVDYSQALRLLVQWASQPVPLVNLIRYVFSWCDFREFHQKYIYILHHAPVVVK